VSIDHRPLGFPSGTAEQHFQRVRTIFDLAPDVRSHRYHVRMSSRGLLIVVTWRGTRDGGEFEIPYINVHEVDAHGKLRRFDSYAPEQLDAALARFAEIETSVAPSQPFANAATTLLARMVEAWRARDWSGWNELFTAKFRFSDRRRMAQLELDRDRFVAFTRELGDMRSAQLETKVLATRGDRLGLWRTRLIVADGAIGPSEIEFLDLAEVDAHGHGVALVRFDAGDQDAAYADLDARFETGEAAAHPNALGAMRAMRDTWTRRDWDGLAATAAPGFAYRDHRLLGWGTSLPDAAAWVRAQQALIELAPDIRTRNEHVRITNRGYLRQIQQRGTRDGGAFEMEFAFVVEVDAQGRATRIELFELEDLDAAKARFEELRPDPLRIPPNAATRVRDRFFRAVLARDWDAVRGLVGAGFVFEDRGKRALVRGDVEAWIASAEFTTSLPGVQIEAPLVATVGGRIAIDQIRWAGSPDGDAFEFGRIRVLEIDTDGRCCAAILFDPDDRAAAFTEAQMRFLAGEAAGVGGQAPFTAGVEAAARRDWDALRALVAADAVIEDRRTLGMGSLSLDAWIESLRAMADLAPDLEREEIRILAWNRHGRVAVVRTFGTGLVGGPFEILFISIELGDGERIRRIEAFDAGDADHAIARFEALCAGRE
jgi:hypothetical protein